MRICVIGFLAVVTATTAFANLDLNRSNTSIYSNGFGITAEATPLDSLTSSSLRVGGVVYSDLESGSGYQAYPAASGALGLEDYDSINDADITLEKFKFIGGVTNAGEILFFDVFDSEENYIDGFGVQLSQGGNYQWTITLNTPIDIPDAGLVQISANDDETVGTVSTGTWFLSDAAPTVGTNDLTIGGAADTYSHKMELVNVPEPATLAMIALGGLALIRRK